MTNPIALTVALAVAASLVVGLAWLSRKSFLVRQFSFPLLIAGAILAVQGYLALASGPAVEVRALRSWLLAFLLVVTVVRLVGLYFFDVHLPARRGVRLPPLLPSVAMFAVYAVAALVTLRLSFPKLDIAPLLATSAVTSLVLGLALQPILGNFFAGLVISLERPFRLNDWVRIGEHEGRVVELTWRTTHLRTRDNDDIVIPNGKVADERVQNFYYPNPMHLERTLVGVHYRTPPYRVRRALLECTQGVRGVLDKPAPDVYLLRFDDSAITYELRTYIDDMASAPRITSELKYRIWEEFRREGIEIPFPIRTLEIARRERPDAKLRPTARLFVAEGPDRGKCIDIVDAAITVGRSRGSTLALTESSASKEHLKIEPSPEGFRLVDLGSSFGTRVNGVETKEALLRPFDRITIGETLLHFEIDS